MTADQAVTAPECFGHVGEVAVGDLCKLIGHHHLLGQAEQQQ